MAAAPADGPSSASNRTAPPPQSPTVWDGTKLNTPNDLAVDRKGRVWFTNPWNAGNIDPSEREELDNRSVLRADPQTNGSYTVTRVTFDTSMPNGILVSQDQQTLYVAESNSERLDLDRELRAYPIREDGSLWPYDSLHTFGKDANAVHRGIDGMCMDAEGNIVAHRRLGAGRPGTNNLRLLPHGPGHRNPSKCRATGPPTAASGAQMAPRST